MVKKIVSIIYKVLRVCVYIFLILFAGLVCMQKFSNNTVSFLSYRIFAVATGSMVPKYNIGDVLLVKEVDTTTLVVGDDITYLGKEGSYKDKVVTHRLIEIDGDKFQTKGIATLNPDPIISKDQIYGKVVKKLKILSLVYGCVTSKTGFYICIIIPIMFLVGGEVVTSMVERFEKKKEK